MSEWSNPVTAAGMDAVRFMGWVLAIWSALAFVNAAHDGSIVFLETALGHSSLFDADFGFGYIVALYLRVIPVLFAAVASCYGALLPLLFLIAGAQFFLDAEARFKHFCIIVCLYAGMHFIAMGFMWEAYDDAPAWLGALGAFPLVVVWLFFAKYALNRWFVAQLGDNYAARREELTERVEELKRENAQPAGYDLTGKWPDDEASD